MIGGGGGVNLPWVYVNMKLIWCNGFPEIYGQLEEGGMGSVYTGICAFFYMCNLVSVVVFHRSMVDWRRGWGLSALVSVHTSICET